MPNDLMIARRAPINVLTPSGLGFCARCSARHIGICDSLHDEDLHFLAGVARQTTVPKGKVFITEGDEARNFFNINGGTVKLYKDLPDGRRHIIGFVSLGGFVGLAAEVHYAFSAEAIEPVQLCLFDRSELRSLFDRFPKVERRLLEVTSHELVLAQEQMLLLGRKTALERVASFLDFWQHHATPCQDPASPLDLPMSRSDLADYLGLTIETVSRGLATLRKLGVVKVGTDHRISILDLGRLTTIGNGMS